MKRTLESDSTVNDALVSHTSTAKTPCLLDVLVSDIFRHMFNSAMISPMDLLMMAWVYVPIRCIVPQNLKGAENLIITAYRISNLYQIHFISKTMLTNRFWTAEAKWFGFLLNPDCLELFDQFSSNGVQDSIEPLLLPYLKYADIQCCKNLTIKLIEAQVHPDVLEFLFCCIDVTVYTDYDVVKHVLDFNYGDSYLDILTGSYYQRHFPYETWTRALRSENYEALTLMITYENDPFCIDIVGELLDLDCDEAFNVLYEAAMLNNLDKETIIKCIKGDRVQSVTRLIEHGFYTPHEDDLPLCEDDEGEYYDASTKMLTIFTNAMFPSKPSAHKIRIL